ncbi:unnamed protein product [Nezara viridula]|uniref:Uncharacterized protein n=1 Tax=Nezara viridula TaxID=85310 RepID=A0A9P0E4Y9_NEZVI|nr:unnamed protein product [Nezara viridula]
MKQTELRGRYREAAGRRKRFVRADRYLAVPRPSPLVPSSPRPVSAADMAELKYKGTRLQGAAENLNPLAGLKYSHESGVYTAQLRPPVNFTTCPYKLLTVTLRQKALSQSSPACKRYKKGLNQASKGSEWNMGLWWQ